MQLLQQQPTKQKPVTSTTVTVQTFMTSSSETACTTYITKHDEQPDQAKQEENPGNVPVPVQQPQVEKLSMLRVLQISLDIAAGLRYLHEMPLVANAVAAQQTGEKHSHLATVEEVDTCSTSYQQHKQLSTPLASPSQQKTTKVVHRGEV